MNTKLQQPLVIIGTGLAGYNLAREIRKFDSEKNLLLITADDGSFYSKPMLSNALAKQLGAQQLVTATAGEMAQELNATIYTHTTITKIDTQTRCVYLGNEPVFYQDLVIAQGAEPIVPPFVGKELIPIYTVNDLATYAQFRQQLQGKKRVLVMGAGLIGCEFANDLILSGLEVDLVAPCTYPMPNLLPQAAAEKLQEALQGLGARFHFATLVQEVAALPDSGWRAFLTNGQTIDFDLLLCAVGLKPRTALAKEAGITCNVGISTDRFLKTSAEHVYALGDCAEVEGYNLQYIMPLMAGVRALAQSLTGNLTAVKYGPMPITLKTPACPVVLAHNSVEGDWTLEGEGEHLKLTQWDAEQLLGYVLLGDSMRDRMKLNRALPPLFG